MKRIVTMSLPLILIFAAYMGLKPVPITPVAWQAPVSQGYTGVHAANTKLQDLHTIDLQGEVGPEHVVIGPDGKLYTGVESGKILRMQPDGSAQEVFCTTGGRPLGMAFDADGQLTVADAFKGLLSIAADGNITVLLGIAEGGPLHFPDAVVVARTGKIYLTDSSTRFTPRQWGSTNEAAMLDIFEQSSTGRVLEYDPVKKSARIIAQGLSFANGIALSGDESSLLVAESGKFRVWKITTAAEQLDLTQPTPQASILFDNLPGYPDNLTRGKDDKLWLGLAGQRNFLDQTAQRPYLRNMALRIPRLFWKMPPVYGHVIAFTEDGKVINDLQDPSGNSPTVTGVTETANRLYIHNVSGKGLGWMGK
ncbi:SMP-30/gluconolactonase/LRE family protein [Undibacterium sp. YM2]|uniref:SMP-30/gluconolactonase/LRE family protein n=1 Tax=Undibacterium sp. YM2 TaxID=2058625 RepID=UPI001389A15E|nr:SMP-30/gluconolactonase/LRE family protein [Undibacterium sp. YM2]